MESPSLHLEIRKLPALQNKSFSENVEAEAQAEESTGNDRDTHNVFACPCVPITDKVGGGCGGI